MEDDFWVLPGGTGELFEPAEDTVRREMTEELGETVCVERLLWVVENFHEYDGRRYHAIEFYYLTKLPSGSPLLDQERLLANDSGTRLFCRWQPVSRLADIDGLPLLPEFLQVGLSDLPVNVQHMCIPGAR